MAGLLGEQAEIEAQHAVGAHLQQHAGQQDGSGGRSFDVGVGQPGVEREQRNLHRKRQEESEEEPLRRGGEVGHLRRARSGRESSTKSKLPVCA